MAGLGGSGLRFGRPDDRSGGTVRYHVAFASGIGMIGGGATLAAIGHPESALVWAGAALTVVGTLGDRLTSFSIGAQGVQGQLDPPTVVQHTLDSIMAERLSAPAADATPRLTAGAGVDGAGAEGAGAEGAAAPPPLAEPPIPGAIPIVVSPELPPGQEPIPLPATVDGNHRNGDLPAAPAGRPAGPVEPSQPAAPGPRTASSAAAPPVVVVQPVPPAQHPAGSESAVSYWSDEVIRKAIAAAASTDPEVFARKLTDLVATARKPEAARAAHGQRDAAGTLSAR